jgi:hypothetical protein
VIHFLFPADPIDHSAPDEMFSGQAAALAGRGFTTSLFPDAALSGGRGLKAIPEGSSVVYRGWMLNRDRYAALEAAIIAAGATAFTNTHDYLSTHHLPNWYPLLADLTPETRVFPADADIAAELRALNWGQYFIKDYVKSVKSRRGSVVRDPTEVVAVLDELREYRGEIEGGICVRRVEEFVTESERRYFVLNGVPYSAESIPVPAIVQECATRIASRFFSIDVVRRTDGAERVVEIGDGQVSDLVGWPDESFAAMWATSNL